MTWLPSPFGTLRLLLTAVLLTAAVATADMFVSLPLAGAWSDGPCPGPEGVTVIVDFKELGGGVQVRCAPGPVGSGFEALSRAGIVYNTTVRSPGFLCRIAGKPAEDPCVVPSPASAFWSYWVAPRGGTWCFSNWGAGNRKPPPGSVEGWSFSLNRSGSTAPPPGIAPPSPSTGTMANPLPAGDCDAANTPATTAPMNPGPTTPPRNPTTTAPTPRPVPNGGAAVDLPPNQPRTGEGGSGTGGGSNIPGLNGRAGDAGTSDWSEADRAEVDARAGDGTVQNSDSDSSGAADGGDPEGASPDDGDSSDGADDERTSTEGVAGGGAAQRRERAARSGEVADLGDGSSRGSAVGFFVTVILTIAIAASTAVTVRLRRRSAED